MVLILAVLVPVRSVHGSGQSLPDSGPGTSSNYVTLKSRMAWFTRDKPALKPEEGERRVRTEGLWLKCEHCGQIIWRKALEDNLQVCPKCEHHERIDARDAPGLCSSMTGSSRSSTRIPDIHRSAGVRRFQALTPSDSSRPAGDTHLRDAIISAAGNLNGRRVHICAMELQFIGGSMGTVVGEVITRAIERSSNGECR